MDVKFVRYRRDIGTATQMALVFEGRRWLHLVTIEPDLRVSRVRPEEARYMTDAGDPTAAALKYLDVAHRNGASERAMKLLKEVLT